MKKSKKPTLKAKTFSSRIGKLSVKPKNLLLFAVIFVGIGSALLILTHAATPTANIEPENGSLATSAITGTDSNASGGKYVQFKAGSGGGGTTGTGPYGLSLSSADYGPADGLPARTTYTGPTTISTAGAVVENVNIVGSLNITANNVTIRNVHFSVPSSWTWQQGNNFVNEAQTADNLSIVDSTFDGRDASGLPVVYDAIGGWHCISVNRVDIQRVGNGIEWGCGSFTNSYLHDIWQAGSESGWHADGIQSDAGDGITVANNYIAMGRQPAGFWSPTSSIGMWADLGNLSNVLVTHNVVEPMGGYEFYWGTKNGCSDSYTVTNVRFVENIVRRAGVLPDDYGVWYSGSGCSLASRTGNVYDDGTPVDQ